MEIRKKPNKQHMVKWKTCGYALCRLYGARHADGGRFFDDTEKRSYVGFTDVSATYVGKTDVLQDEG